MAEYRLAPTAELDLEGIWRHTAKQWNIEQAHRYQDKLTAAFEALVLAPRTAPACDHVRAGYRRRSIESHIIYFRITGYGVEIMRILHGRMDAPRHL